MGLVDDDPEMDVEYSMDLIETEEHPIEAVSGDFSRPDTPLSPRDIEISVEDTVSPEPVEDGQIISPDYGQLKQVKLELTRIILPSNCIMSSSRVDLGVLRSVDPALFPGEGFQDRGAEVRGRPKGKENRKKKSQDRDSEKKKPRKSSPKKKEKTVKKTVEKMFSSGSDSDSDLEEIRRKIYKKTVPALETKMSPRAVKKVEKKKTKKPPPMVLPTPCCVELIRLSEKTIERHTKPVKPRTMSLSSNSSRPTSSMSSRSKSPATSRSVGRSSSSLSFRSRSKSSSSSRSSSRSSSVKPQKRKLLSESDSSSDEAPAAKKKLFVNPFAKKKPPGPKLPTQQLERPEDVKQALMEKLKTLVAVEEPSKSTELKSKEEKGDEGTPDKDHEKKVEQRKPSVEGVDKEKTKKVSDEKKTDRGPTFNLKIISNSHRLKQFYMVLRIENPQYSFLSKEPVSLVDFENEIKKVIEQLGQSESHSKKEAPVRPTSSQIEKYKLKRPKLKVIDISKSTTLRERYSKARETYLKHRKSIVVKHRQILQEGLKDVRKKVNDEQRFGYESKERDRQGHHSSHKGESGSRHRKRLRIKFKIKAVR